MAFEIIMLQAMLLVGAELRTTNQECAQTIPPFWGAWVAENKSAKIGSKIDDAVTLGVYTKYDQPFDVATGTYSLIIGSPVTHVEQLPVGFVSHTIPAGKYAVFTAQGPIGTAVYQAWQEIWQTPLERTFTSDFEWYDARSTGDENSIVKIYIAIK